MKAMDERRNFQRVDKPLGVDFSFLGEPAGIAGNNVFSGFIEDISLGGIRIQLRERYGKLYRVALQGERIKMSFSFPQFDHTVFTTGIIRWSKKTTEHTDQLITLGVKFIDLAPTDQQYLENYLSSSQGDQNLLWDLWNKEIRP
ncbi:MAG: PilZ domain-containing protein [Deltaproteobacteria bacterium]|nr:PilZ domain-containing protein [Deltaproteobacteria bacterium]